MSRNPITVVCICPIDFAPSTNQAAKAIDPSGDDWLGHPLRVVGQGGDATHKCFHVLLTYEEAEAYCAVVSQAFDVEPLPHDTLESRRECLDQLKAACLPYGILIEARDEEEELGPLHLWEVVAEAGFEPVPEE